MASNLDLLLCDYSWINQLLGGGLRRGTICLLEEGQGESSGLPSMVGTSFLVNGVRGGESGILLLSEHTVNEYRIMPGVKTLLNMGKPGQILFIDAMTSMTFGEPTTPPEEGVIRCSNIRYSAKFYEEIRSATADFQRPRMYIDSLSVLLHVMESDKDAWRFWLSFLPLIRFRKLTIIASFYPEMHSPQFTESMERICDAIIRFTASPSIPQQKRSRYVQVIKNRGLRFDDQMYTYIITEDDIQPEKTTSEK